MQPPPFLFSKKGLGQAWNMVLDLLLQSRIYDQGESTSVFDVKSSAFILPGYKALITYHTKMNELNTFNLVYVICKQRFYN